MNKLFFTALISVLLFSCGSPESQKTAQDDAEEKKATPVRVMKVEPQDYVETGEYYGSTSGMEEATLVSVMGGTVKKISVIEGQKVAAGDSLGEVNAQQAMASYELARLNEKISRENFQRQKNFLAQGNASQLTLDQAQLAWLTSQTSLLDAEKVKNGALCISPIQGTVVQSFIRVNQELRPGAPTFSVARTDKMLITFGIPERDMSGVSLGNPAKVTFGAFPGKVWAGKLVRLSKELNDGNRTFTAEVEIDNEGGDLLVGITAKVGLTRSRLSNQIVIPSSAILSTGDESYVMIEENNMARKIVVQTGSSTRDQTRIVDGPAFGSRLITEGNHLVTDGSRVRVIEDAEI